MVSVSPVVTWNGLGFRLAAVNRRHWPEAMDDPQGLSGATLQVLLIIQQAPKDHQGWHEITHATLVELSHRHRTTVHRVLKILIERGYIVRDTSARGWHVPHRYQVRVK